MHEGLHIEQLFEAAKTGKRVRNIGSDYKFEGEVRVAFTKRSGVVRVVVENDDGILHIFSPKGLEICPDRS